MTADNRRPCYSYKWHQCTFYSAAENVNPCCNIYTKQKYKQWKCNIKQISTDTKSGNCLYVVITALQDYHSCINSFYH